MPEFSPELCSKTWVPVMDHIVRQAKLSDNTLEEHLCNLLGSNQTLRPYNSTNLALISPTPKVHAVKTVHLVK